MLIQKFQSKYTINNNHTYISVALPKHLIENILINYLDISELLSIINNGCFFLIYFLSKKIRKTIDDVIYYDFNCTKIFNNCSNYVSTYFIEKTIPYAKDINSYVVKSIKMNNIDLFEKCITSHNVSIDLLSIVTNTVALCNKNTMYKLLTNYDYLFNVNEEVLEEIIKKLQIITEYTNYTNFMLLVKIYNERTDNVIDCDALKQILFNTYMQKNKISIGLKYMNNHSIDPLEVKNSLKKSIKSYLNSTGSYHKLSKSTFTLLEKCYSPYYSSYKSFIDDWTSDIDINILPKLNNISVFNFLFSNNKDNININFDKILSSALDIRSLCLIKYFVEKYSGDKKLFEVLSKETIKKIFFGSYYDTRLYVNNTFKNTVNYKIIKYFFSLDTNIYGKLDISVDNNTILRISFLNNMTYLAKVILKRVIINTDSLVVMLIRHICDNRNEKLFDLLILYHDIFSIKFSNDSLLTNMLSYADFKNCSYIVNYYYEKFIAYH